MTNFEKFWQKFFIFVFSSISAVIIIVGSYRAKSSQLVSEAPNQPDKNPNDSTVIPALGTNAVLSFAGKIFQTPYGNVSASIKIKDGKVVAVTMPNLPDSPPSIYAKPYLISQAIQAGSANIQGVTGATYTSSAFRLSLESALVKAGAKGQTIFTQSPSTARPPHAPRPGLPIITTPKNTDPGALSFVGKIFSSQYGDTSVAIKIKDGKIVEVTTPNIPNSPPSLFAQPYLVDQALKAGGTNIQGVSGATFTSNAFKSSLESALAQATAQGQTIVSAPAGTTPASTPTVPLGLRDDD